MTDVFHFIPTAETDISVQKDADGFSELVKHLENLPYGQRAPDTTAFARGLLKQIKWFLSEDAVNRMEPE